jgi:glutamate synthase (NADPH/NADH) large chain
MTGGEALVWDPNARLSARLNTALVEAERPGSEHLDALRKLVERHAELTGSRRAIALLADWTTTGVQMWLVAPKGRARRRESENAGRVGASA